MKNKEVRGVGELREELLKGRGSEKARRGRGGKAGTRQGGPFSLGTGQTLLKKGKVRTRVQTARFQKGRASLEGDDGTKGNTPLKPPAGRKKRNRNILSRGAATRARNAVNRKCDCGGKRSGGGEGEGVMHPETLRARAKLTIQEKKMGGG